MAQVVLIDRMVAEDVEYGLAAQLQD